MIEKRHFRVLYREFLFRLVDIELLSSHALGDTSKLLGQFAALLLFVSTLFAFGAMGVGDHRTAPALRLFLAYSAEHLMIATTMLVVGLFGVLSWDTTFPDRRDVLVLSPLPVRGRTLFLAKIAAGATALCVTVAMLHGVAGLAWPVALGLQGTVRVPMPALSYLPAERAAGAPEMERLLQRDLGPWLPPEMGVTVGIIRGGERRVMAFGAARRDSIYQVGSISKTFTGLVLAEMAADGHVQLDEPVRELLPPGTLRKPGGREITLRDLATHRSHLPPMPNNARIRGVPNPWTGYERADLFAFVARRGAARPANSPFIYSNLGFGLLGQALAEREGLPYSELVAQRIAGPMGLADTGLSLSPDQQRRLIPGYSTQGELRPPWEIGALAPAGGLYSTADDMLTYLEAQLREGSAAMRLSHAAGQEAIGGMRVALAWIYDEATGVYWHNGAISGHTSHAFFHPREGYAAIVLVNQAPSLVTFSDLVARHVRARLRGEPAISLATVEVPRSGGLFGVARMFAAYWTTMLLAGAFVYLCMLGLQGAAAQLLPRRVFLRVSSYLQLGVFCGLICVYLLQPLLATGGALIEANGNGVLSWSPSFWFLGLMQELCGSPALAPLAGRAWRGLAVAAGVTWVVYSLTYLRTLRRIAEEPDITPGIRGAAWLPRFGGGLDTAIVQFSIRTLLRSRRHRLILAVYLGIGLAFLILLVKTPAVRQQLDDAPVADVWGQVNTPLLAASIAMMGFAILGTRVIFSLPLDLRANWIFQVTGVRRADECLGASRMSLWALSLLPVWLVSAAVCFRMWPWEPAAGHLAILGLLGLILGEVCLYGFQKIPFTCSYLPGRSQMHLSVLGTLGMLWWLALSVRYERQVLESAAATLAVLAMLGVVAGGAVWSTRRMAGRSEEEVRFEDAPEPAVRELGLNRDGWWRTNS